MNNTLTMRYPSSWNSEMWREAIPVGNGEIGGMVYGGVQHEIITVNHGRLWWKNTDCELPDVSYTLPKIRKLLRENKPVIADSVMQKELEKNNYSPSLGIPLSVCDINIIMNSDKPFKNYLRTLAMEKAEARVKWCEGDTTFFRNFFVSRCDDSAYYKITSDVKNKIDASVYLSLHDLQTLGEETLPTDCDIEIEKNFIYFAAKKDDKTDFGAVCRIEHDGEMIREKNMLHIKSASHVEMKLKVFIRGSRKIEFEKIKNELQEDFSYDEELTKHAAIHKSVFSSSIFEINNCCSENSNEQLLLDAYSGEAPDELIEKMWKFGRYLLVAASKKGGYPCQLYGLWCGHHNPPWPWNMFNINIQMIYWQSLSGNMSELLLNVFDYVEERINEYRENAKKLFGCRGINICAVSTPVSSLHKLSYPHILHWTGGAGWIAQHYFDYWLCTRDKEFLRNRAMPFMAETALFYEDFLIEDENGFLMSAPSVSPENVPENVLRDFDSNAQTAVNATMDFAIVKELLTNLIKGSEITGLYDEKVELWKSMLRKIPPYVINKDGAISEWIHPFYEDNYCHRHESHLYAFFPGTEVTRKSDKKLYNAFIRATELRKCVGLKDQTGWSLSFMANVYARAGDGDSALECIDMITRSNVIGNLFTVHNDWRRMGIACCNEMAPPVQLDSNMGISAAINEMALYSTEKEVYLFNAIPKKWKTGKIGPLLSRTNTQITLSWDEKTAKVDFFQLVENADVVLILPEKMKFLINNSNEISIHLSKNEKKTLDIKNGE